MDTIAVLSNPSLHSTNLLQRVEAAFLLCLVVLAYDHFTPHRWLLFAILFFAPDIALFAYARNVLAPHRAAAVYNSLHSYIGPTLLLLAGLALAPSMAIAVALVWAAHIAFDRTLGYGLKLPDGFPYTHLGLVGPLRNSGAGTLVS